MKNPFFRIGLGVLMVTFIIFMLRQINFVFEPVIIFAQTLAMPFIVAGILYYLLHPLYQYMLNKGLNQNIAISIIYIGIIMLGYGFFSFISPIIAKQLKLFSERIPELVNSAVHLIEKISHNEMLSNVHLGEKFDTTKIVDFLNQQINQGLSYVGTNIFDILSTVTSIAMLLIVVPFILFYLLKDGHKIPNLLSKVLPTSAEREAKHILTEMNFALSSYIRGQLLVSFIVGITVYIGYVIIGLDFALLLAIIAMITNFIPFAGPFIGLGFAVVVGLMDSIGMAIGVCIVVLIVQQVESNFISPQIIGNKLRIHPLTIILILLFASKLIGILGMLIAVPTYAIAKVVLTNALRLWKLKKHGNKKNHPDFQ